MADEWHFFIKRLNKTLNKSMAFLTPTGMVLGLLLSSRISWMKPIVTVLFALVTLIGALGMDLSDFKQVLNRPKPLLTVFICSHIFMPTFIWMFANLFFSASPDVVVGFILLSAIPIAVSSYVWSSIYYGKGSLSLSIILLDTLLAPFLTPLTVRIFTRTNVVFDASGIMRSLFLMVVIPSIIGMAINHFAYETVTKKVLPNVKPLSKIFLFLVVLINASQIGSRVTFKLGYLKIAALNIALTVLGFLLAYGLSRLMHFEKDEQVSITYGGTLRNLNAALVLALQFFPPESSIPVVFGIIVQQILSAFMGKGLFGRYQDKMQRLE
ncbi:MAG: bile acid:sodium symporter family protein [Peptostreptococcaceae bacterium]|nr:bile acid:sodium symporter family protein [Peptostreptococcaceae bacterium]